MPKKNGIMKTYSFAVETVNKLNELCKMEKRTQTNCIERLIEKEYERIGVKEGVVENGK